MQTRTPRALAAATLMLVAGACSDAPTAAPAAGAIAGPAALASPSGPRLISNAIRYRDQGGKPATGRSGSARVDAIALLDRQGVTTLRMSARHVADSLRSGSISKAQVKAFDREGLHLFTRNYGGGSPAPREVQLTGLGRGYGLQLQANVRGLDGRRTDVVTVNETVKLLPELRVRMSAPAQAEPNTWVNILATVSEHNGDVGATAVCELYVAGQLVDDARGIWVDAGDAVTCLMTWRFAAGTYPIEVRVSTPGQPEWDPSNNTDVGTIMVRSASAFTGGVYFFQSQLVTGMFAINSWRNTRTGTSGTSQSSGTSVEIDQRAEMVGGMPVQITGPVRVRVSMSTGGVSAYAAEWTDPGAGPSGWCRQRAEGRTMFWLCTGAAAGAATPKFTYFRYSYMPGAVTYHGSGYSRVWDGAEPYVYHENSGESGSPTLLRGDWTINVRLGTPGGEFPATGTVWPRLDLNSTWVRRVDPSCVSFDDGQGYSGSSCISWLLRRETWSGASDTKSG